MTDTTRTTPRTYAHLLVTTVLLALTCGCEEPKAPSPTASPPDTPQKTVQAPSTRPAAKRPAARPPWTPHPDRRVARFAGLEGPKPVTWQELPPVDARQSANFVVPGLPDTDQAHLVVYEGRVPGGAVDQVIAEWRETFRPDVDGVSPQPLVSHLEADGMPITVAELEGAQIRPGTQWYTEDQLFIGAIIERPTTPVYVHFNGDAVTVDARRADFLELIRNLRHVPADEGSDESESP